MKKIKVYDIDKWVKDKLDNKKPHKYNELAVVRNNEGVVVFDKADIRFKLTDTSCLIKLGLNREGDAVNVFPTFTIKVSVQEIIESCPVKKEVELKKYYKGGNINEIITT